MAELLVELLSEEIPARMQARAAADFARLVENGLEKAALGFDTARHFVTPRRLTLVIDGLPEHQPDITEEKRGPRVGAPDKAINGFLRANGLDSLDACEQRDGDKGSFWYLVVTSSGRPTAEILPALLLDALRALP